MRTVNGSSTTISTGNVIFTLVGFAGMYLLLGLICVLLLVFEALQGPIAGGGEEKQPQEAEGIGDQTA